MRAKIRRFHSPDIVDLREHEPVDERDFAFLLQVMVGPDDGPGEESFDIVVGTPASLWRDLNAGRMVWGRHRLIVDRYDWPAIEAFVRARFESVRADDWEGVAAALGRYGRWEFEDHRPAT